MSIKYNDKTNNREILLAGVSPVDTLLSPTSKNAIANKTVYNALLEKVEKTVTDLINYYTKTDTYNKAEVRELIGAINTLTIEVVSSLPSSDISTTTIYFLKQASPSTSYDEYVYVNNAWVKIGDTNIDLSQYVTSSVLTAALNDYYNKAAVDNLLTSYYTKTEIDTTMADYYDKNEVDDLIAGIPSNPVDAVTDGDMHAVTSNAVFDAFGAESLFRRYSPTREWPTDGSVDLNDIRTPGPYIPYLIRANTPNGPGFYSYLVVFRWGVSDNATQVAIGYNVPYIAMRYYNSSSGGWSAWKVWS